MLYDEAFVAAAHADPDTAFAGSGLTAAERKELLCVDRRAWRTDPLRRRRTLRMIFEEYKVSSTLALAETRRLAFLEGYFSSPEFHAAVLERRPIALAFGEFLEAAAARGVLKTPQLPDIIRLEAAMARCRRDLRAEISDAPEGSTRVRLAPGYAALTLEANVIASIQKVEQYLFEIGLMPAVALCDDHPCIGELPPVSEERLYLLLFPSEGNVSLSYLDAPTCEMLALASRATPRAEIAAALAKRHIPASAVHAALDSSLEEGILVRC
jgi:hypothetical protein